MLIGIHRKICLDKYIDYKNLWAFGIKFIISKLIQFRLTFNIFLKRIQKYID